VIDDINSELKELWVKVVFMNIDENLVMIDDIKGEVIFICDAAEAVGENTGGVMKLSIIDEFLKVAFRYITFKVFRVDKDGREVIFIE
jgi:hypothetical protein